MGTADNTQRTTGSTTYTTLTSPLSLTVPLAGDYAVRVDVDIQNSSGSVQTFLSYTVGGTPADDNWAAEIFTTATNLLVPGTLETTQTGVAANAVIQEQARVTGGTGSYKKRRLWIRPVRVG